MSLAARSPRSRKSLSLTEHDINVEQKEVKVVSGKHRNVAVNGEPGVAFQAGKAGEEMSPRRKARRQLQPRKSILKSLTRPEDFEENTAQYAHTMTFGSSMSLSRRVSFAPNAHVRMFDRPPAMSPDGTPVASGAPFPLPPAATAAPRQSISSHSRRSSITSIGSVSKPNVFAPSTFRGEGETQGEESMDIEPDSEESDADENGAGAGPVGRFAGDAGAFTFGDAAKQEDEEDMEEEDMDMDITQNVFGGIVRRASMAANTTVDSEVDSVANTSTPSDEEKTMDFTVAIGGLLPSQAPAGAMRNRNSIGYSIPMPEGTEYRAYLPGEAIEGEVEIEMEETIAFGGIIGPDDTLSSAGSEDTLNGGTRERTMTFNYNQSHLSQHDHPDDQDDGAMEMTIATGGIINLPPVSPAPTMPASVRVLTSTPSAPYPPVSPAQGLPTNTRPTSGTPSFARATVSSGQKSKEKEPTSKKRNVFAPSPSPEKTTTPKKTGLQVAGEVAKRLSFGSTPDAGSSQKRTRRESSTNETAKNVSNKKARVSFAPPPASNVGTEEVFGTPIFQSAPVSRASLLAPRSSLGTPMRLVPSPSAARARVSIVAQEASVEEIELNKDSEKAEAYEDEAEPEQEWEQQPMSIAAFLEMAGVPFMEHLPGANRRRSSVGRGLLGRSYAAGDRDFALQEYAEAQVNQYFVNMYTWATNQLTDYIRKGSAELNDVEARCEEHQPPVISEYLSASDEDKQLFEMTFKSFKTNTHLRAKERWYTWKKQLIDTIEPDVKKMLKGMREDNERLTDLNDQLSDLIPDLKAKQAALQAELAKEREVVAKIAACDQSELLGYKEGIAEQSTQIAMFTAELEESSAKLSALTTKLNELNATKQECVTAISHAKSQCDQFTRSDAIRLQEELDSMHHLHLWRPTQIHSDRLSLEFDHEILLTFDCESYIVNLDTARIEYLHEKVKESKKGGPVCKGDTPTESFFGMLRCAVEGMVSEKTCTTLSSMVQQIGQLWSTAQRLRSEMHYVNFRYPITYTFSPQDHSLMASVTIMLPRVKSKIVLDFVVSQEVLWGYPETLAGTETAIRQIYGQADLDLLNECAKSTMSSSTSQGCLGAFLQVCLDVGAEYGGK
ncbi:hypothetical protein I316_02445 [Kwoniella heveanensis BCC8398]|uniref:Spc7 kinetochore protein domain-containing protein n=1 Tax=Kwoniella heveanensis BCC8398 TaxID=1296120 RepID=A0A1B9GY73_9TREE|nr:hypothetical protein I316_02445 [Kwoniella heveanensis BCC8398]